MTQKETIARHLADFGSITSLECVTEYGIIDGRKCISDLRKDGIKITASRQKHINRYGKHVIYNVYRLET